jgi:hypothetical protein
MEGWLMTFAALLRTLDALATLPEGGKGDLAVPVTPTSIARAKQWLTDTHEEVWCQTPYNTPQIASDEEGGVCLQWRSGMRKITVFVADEEAWYLQVWDRMENSLISDGDAEPIEERKRIFAWLVDGEVATSDS